MFLLVRVECTTNNNLDLVPALAAGAQHLHASSSSKYVPANGACTSGSAATGHLCLL